MYRDKKTGEVEHSGIVIESGDSPFYIPRIVSKFGKGSEVVHQANDSPYCKDYEMLQTLIFSCSRRTSRQDCQSDERLEMSRLSADELSSLVETYTVSNIPGFLYRRFSGNLSVQRIAQEATACELREAYEAAVSEDPRTTESVARAYAMLVALTLRPVEEINDELPKLRGALDWTRAILEIASAARRASEPVQMGADLLRRRKSVQSRIVAGTNSRS